MEESFDEHGYESSLDTRISEIIPKNGKRFQFEYEYDFGDSWHHEIVFDERYPVCVEGERACPPEDVGGTIGYEEYLEAMADSEHDRNEEYMQWRGPFDSEAFDAVKATKKMRRGLPDWRKEVWI